MILSAKILGLVAVGSLVLSGFTMIYGYRWGAQSVEDEYDARRADQRNNAQAVSESYEHHRRNTDMTKIRKEIEDEIKNSPIYCVVADGQLLRLYEAAGVRNHTR